MLLHYAPVSETIVGEPEGIWAFLGSGRMAIPIGAHRPDVVFHGHAHHGRPSGAIGAVPVHNVARHVIDGDFLVTRAVTAASEPVRRPGAIRGAWAVLRLAVDEAREHRVAMTAQALAYSLFLAIPASLLVLLGIFSLVSDPSDVGQLVDRLESVMPPEAAELLGDSLERSSRSPRRGAS